jgi:5-methyltetrahydropteroyltriglutamate--homocysteine methyltransferase
VGQGRQGLRRRRRLAGALCLPFANPRHSHEVDAFRTQKLPDRMTLVCGVVETTHNYVEHPQVIAERLDVVWAKLEAMRDGAAIASKRLWS